MKKNIMSKKGLLILLVLLLGGGGLFAACGNCHKGKDPEKMLKRMDKKVARLDLTAPQQAIYDDIRADLKADITEMQDLHRERGMEIAGELKKETPSMEKIVAQVKTMPRGKEKLFNKYADRFLEFYNALDAEQQEEILERMRDFAEHFE